MGNDPLAHVSAAFLFTLKFGWWGLIPSFFSHFIIDTIPHGHVKSNLTESVKGGLVAMVLFFWIIFHQNLALAICFFFNFVAAIIYDVFLILATKCDEKEFWKKFTGHFRSVIFNLTVATIKINYFTHWMVRASGYASYKKSEPEKINCLPGRAYFPLRVSWLNLGQLIWSIVVLYIAFQTVP